MGKTQKIVTVLLWGFLVLLMLGIVGAGLYKWRRDQTAERLPVYYDAPHFSLVDQNNRPFSEKDLRGRVWICDLIFTQCAGPCPAMTKNMCQLQKLLSDPRVHFLSISIDPDNDTPEVLRKYAASFSADEKRCTFLTGDKNTIYETARGLKMGADPAQPGSATPAAQPPSHDTHFLLVDADGHIRGIFNMKDGESVRQLADQTRLLLAETKE